MCLTDLNRPDDAAAASAKVRGNLPGHEKEAKKAGEEGYEALRARAESLVSGFHNNMPAVYSYMSVYVCVCERALTVSSGP